MADEGEGTDALSFVSQTAQAMFVLGGVVIVGGVAGAVVALASGIGFGVVGLVVAVYAAWRLGWTGYRLDVLGDEVMWKAPMTRLSCVRSSVHGVRSPSSDFNIVYVEMGAPGDALPFWRSAGLQEFVDRVTASS